MTTSSAASQRAALIERFTASGPPFKMPAHVVFRSAPLPRTQSGKVLRRDLRSAIASELRDG
jgi:acyl-coenzyme A synthetase/AMP-(fatty) acid ligase